MVKTAGDVLTDLIGQVDMENQQSKNDIIL